jgi:hypothetical protein
MNTPLNWTEAVEAVEHDHVCAPDFEMRGSCICSDRDARIANGIERIEGEAFNSGVRWVESGHSLNVVPTRADHIAAFAEASK